MSTGAVRHFLDLADISPQELRGMIAAARAMKERPESPASLPLEVYSPPAFNSDTPLDPNELAIARALVRIIVRKCQDEIAVHPDRSTPDEGAA